MSGFSFQLFQSPSAFCLLILFIYVMLLLAVINDFMYLNENLLIDY